MKVVIGINNIPRAIGGFHESAAALVIDGKLVSMIEEERLNRIRHSGGYPYLAVPRVLGEAGLTLDDVDLIAIGQNPYFWLKEGHLRLHPEMIWHEPLNALIMTLYKRRVKNRDNKKIVNVDHHLAHAASTFRCSGFKEANILTVDSSGERESAAFFVGRNKKIQRLWTLYHSKVFDQGKVRSIGRVYSGVTSLLGLGVHGEGKTMGLAAYGEPTFDFNNILNIKSHRDYKINYALVNKHFGYLRRQPNDPLTQDHKNLAASLQSALEQSLLNLTREAYKRTGIRYFCLAGGVALNCNTNGLIMNEPYVDDIYIQPAANDGGVSLGAALEVYSNHFEPISFRMDNAYYGPGYSNEQIEKALGDTKMPYRKIDNIEKKTAELLADGKIIGWFQGRMEIGPRALGNRSILADPRDPGMADRVNEFVKHREKWRPFAPSILREKMGEYFTPDKDSPFMILAFKVKPEKRNIISAVTHIDGSARVQTVTKEQNPRYYKLIRAFGELTGVPVVLNTSFNDKGEPIVMTPKDAIRCFYSTGLDVLVIGDFLIEK